MMQAAPMLVAFLIASTGNVEPKKTSRLVCEIPYMAACKGVVNNAVVFDQPASTSLRGRGEYLLNGAFNVTRGAKRIAEIRLDIVRCRDSVSSNTCEHFHSWRLNGNPCKAWVSQGLPWSALINGIHPNISCPSRQGSYKIVDAGMDMKVIEALHLPLEGAVWKIEVHHLEPSGALHACFDTTYIYHRVRV